MLHSCSFYYRTKLGFIQALIIQKNRKNKKEELYRQTLLAYGEAIEERRKRKQKGKKGLLKEAGLILEKRYNWGEGTTDSYKVRRYLDRAEKIWHISSMVETKEKLNKRR